MDKNNPRGRENAKQTTSRRSTGNAVEFVKCIDEKEDSNEEKQTVTEEETHLRNNNFSKIHDNRTNESLSRKTTRQATRVK